MHVKIYICIFQRLFAESTLVQKKTVLERPFVNGSSSQNIGRNGGNCCHATFSPHEYYCFHCFKSIVHAGAWLMWLSFVFKHELRITDYGIFKCPEIKKAYRYIPMTQIFMSLKFCHMFRCFA